MNIVTRIYGLFDPSDNSCFYVGRTVERLARRLTLHKTQARQGRDKSRKGDRLREMFTAGKDVKIIELAQISTLDPDEVIQTEQAWIDFMGLTHDLLNTAPASGGRINWLPKLQVSDELIHWLETETSVSVAKRLGVTPSVIGDLRHKLGIPSKFVRKQIDWTDDLIARLGVDPDIAIAKDLGIDRCAITSKRVALNIPNPVTGKVKTTRRCKIVLSDEIVAQLGTMADTDLAKIAGTSPNTIMRNRQKRGIPPFEWVRPKSEKPNIPDAAIDDLGKMTDREVAEKHGVSKPRIYNARRRLGIPKYSKTTQYSVLKESA